MLVVGDCGRRLLYTLRRAVLYGCVLLHSRLRAILIAVLVGRRRSGVLRLGGDWDDGERCRQRCGCERISEETSGRHGFTCLLGLRLSGNCVVRPDFAASKDEFQPGRFASVKCSVD